ncbi:MAG: hypothetical protein RL095_3183 [Verrucomicrobiota bacterium]|jgi:tRNA threonylcarbamoyladenosine biosynthesis protein TsaE
MRLFLHDESATLALGSRLAAGLRLGDCLLLEGDLGAGKSCLARGIARALGVTGELPSPTFPIVLEHPLPEGGRLCHMDLYRLDSPEEVQAFGIEDYLNERRAICLIEWPERLGWLRPPHARSVSLRPEGEGRVAEWS